MKEVIKIKTTAFFYNSDGKEVMKSINKRTVYGSKCLYEYQQQ